jgi:hypothetical protein
MALLPLLIAMGGALYGGLAKKAQGTQDYSKLPTVADPNIWQAGTAASRAGRGASGLTDGTRWTGAGGGRFMMPGLIGR